MKILKHVVRPLEEVDGAEDGEEGTIHRLPTQATRLTLGSDTPAGQRLRGRAGGLDFGVGL